MITSAFVLCSWFSFTRLCIISCKTARIQFNLSCGNFHESTCNFFYVCLILIRIYVFTVKECGPQTGPILQNDCHLLRSVHSVGSAVVICYGDQVFTNPVPDCLCPPSWHESWRRVSTVLYLVCSKLIFFLLSFLLKFSTCNGLTFYEELLVRTSKRKKVVKRS